MSCAPIILCEGFGNLIIIKLWAIYYYSHSDVTCNSLKIMSWRYCINAQFRNTFRAKEYTKLQRAVFLGNACFPWSFTKTPLDNIYAELSNRGRNCLHWSDKCFCNGTKVCHSRWEWHHQRKVCQFSMIFSLQKLKTTCVYHVVEFRSQCWYAVVAK